jgi:hypothetical protein
VAIDFVDSGICLLEDFLDPFLRFFEREKICHTRHTVMRIYPIYERSHATPEKHEKCVSFTVELFLDLFERSYFPIELTSPSSEKTWIEIVAYDERFFVLFCQSLSKYHAPVIVYTDFTVHPIEYWSLACIALTVGVCSIYERGGHEEGR